MDYDTFAACFATHYQRAHNVPDIDNVPFVYVLSDGGDDRYKIGHSRHLLDRCKDTMLCEPQLHAVIAFADHPVDEYGKNERRGELYMHHALAPYRMGRANRRTEWFRCPLATIYDAAERRIERDRPHTVHPTYFRRGEKMHALHAYKLTDTVEEWAIPRLGEDEHRSHPRYNLRRCPARACRM